MEIFVNVLELIGTVAFAASGALIAMKKHMDLLGVIVLGVVTAIGGGILRDLILGITPPLAFRDPTCAIVAIGTAIVLFIPWVRHGLMHNTRLFDAVLLVMDSVGLGVFTVMGIWNALSFSPDRSTFLLVFVGVLTGVGGGVIRDVLAGDMPYILVKHIYACASLLGAVTCALLWRCLPQYAAMLIAIVLVLVIRLLSAYFRWNLPRANDVD
ncbi:MAG: trimeric intracellular cation channel family protein [Faecousia sp.]